MFFSFVLLIEVIDRHKKTQRIYGIETSYMKKKDLVKNSKFFSNLYKKIEIVCIEKDKEEYAKPVFYGTIITSIGLALYFISIKQVLFAVGVPVVLVLTIKKVFELLVSDSNEKIEEQLPILIDNFIKVFSKYSDLKTVVYETSLLVEEPMRSKLDRLSRKMLSEDHVRALMDFADELDNIWIYSMVFIILSYKEEAKKEDVILNLRHLSAIIDKENSLKTASITDKKYGIVLNYAIACIAGAGGVANIMFNPMGKTFFFGSIGGILCFTIGYGAIILTILLNIHLSTKKRKG